VSGCGDVRIERPEQLWVLWLVPLLMVFLAWAGRARRAALRRFASEELLERLVPARSPARRRVKSALLILAVLALVVSLAGFKMGFEWEEIRRRGVDIVVVLDVSDSMLVLDTEAGGTLSRLERAKREIRDLLQLLEGDRIGLVAFAGTAFLECPLTLDYGAAEIFLDSLAPDLIPVKGTAIGEAIRTAVEAFGESSSTSKAIVLMTDGEDHLGEAVAAAEAAAAAGIRIFTIGIGRDEGSPIPQDGGGFRRDSRGDIILSRLDEPTLQRIALATGGRYVRSVTGDVDLEQVYSLGIKATLEDQELGTSRQRRWKERFQWFVGAAILLLLLEASIGERAVVRRGVAS
jgi:Ca-activated chloride channel family protein